MPLRGHENLRGSERRRRGRRPRRSHLQSTADQSRCGAIRKFGKFVVEFTDKWGKVIREAGIEVE
jgi:hypothetical protein